MRKCLPAFTIILFISFFGCRKEKTVVVTVPVVHSWLMDSFVANVDKILTASLPLNDSILAVANRSAIWYINANKPNTPINGIYIPGTSQLYSIFYAPSMTKNLSVSVLDPNHLNIYETHYPVYPFGITSFSPTYSGSATSTKGLSFPAVISNAGYPIVNSKYILAPCEIDFATEKAYFSLLKLDTTRLIPDQPAVSVVSTTNLVLTPAPSTTGFSDGGFFSASYFGKFFVSYYNQFYRVDTSGNVKAFGYCPVAGQSGSIYNMFTLNNFLFALGNGKFFVSQDQGESWTLFLDATGNIYGNLNYMNVGNDLYGVTGSQIAKVTMSGNTFNYKQLDNDGLATNSITSINTCGKYAFITTLSGLFYRDTASFNASAK